MRMPRLVLCLFLFLISMEISQAQTKEPDYSSYDISKTYFKDKNYLFAYKYLIIFKFTNLQLLTQSVNKDALSQLDRQIGQMEDYIRQNVGWIDLKRARGFSDHQVDSALKDQSKKIEFRPIEIK